tara:strand:- start:40 stop:315 length:276 start_codon:yes stop_codon:yes gene_type:complete
MFSEKENEQEQIENGGENESIYHNTPWPNLHISSTEYHVSESVVCQTSTLCGRYAREVPNGKCHFSASIALVQFFHTVEEETWTRNSSNLA